MGTIKQKKTAELVVKTLKGESKKNAGEILDKVGYSKNVSRSPKPILESEGFLEEFNKLIPDRKLTNKHNELLFDEKSEIQIKALDLAYKIKGSYAPEKKESVNLNLNSKLEGLKDSKKIKQLATEYEEKLKKTLEE